jgi:mono/diheme cytochrome c family protein
VIARGRLLAADRDLAAGMAAVHERRCAACHGPQEVTRLDWVDLRQPERSLFLAAPLEKAAGGSGRCNPVTYSTAQDADYQAALGAVRDAARKAWQMPRRDLQALERPAWIAREGEDAGPLKAARP